VGGGDEERFHLSLPTLFARVFFLDLRTDSENKYRNARGGNALPPLSPAGGSGAWCGVWIGGSKGLERAGLRSLVVSKKVALEENG